MRRGRGLSLVEVILSIFLLAIGISLIAYLIPFALKGNSRTRILTSALFWGQERMEEALARADAPDEEADPQEPLLTGRVKRSVWSQDSSMVLVAVDVFRSDDAARRPLVHLETLVAGASN